MLNNRVSKKTLSSGIQKLFISFFLFFLFCGCGQQEANPGSKDTNSVIEDSFSTTVELPKTEFDTLIQKKLRLLVKSGNFSGTVIISAKDGRQFNLSTGYADFDKKALNSDSTLFQIASLTKIFTALGILNLEQSGKLKFTDPFTKYLKFVLPYNNISIRNLLDHTAGLPDYVEIAGKYWKGNSGPDNSEIFQLYRDNKVASLSPPGKSFAYSNINYIILGSMIEDISGKTLEQYVRDLSGSNFTGVKVYGKKEYDEGKTAVATAYGSTGEKYVKIPEASTKLFENRKGSGGLFVTPSDFDVWMRNMFFDLDYYRNILTNKEIRSKVGSSDYVLGWYHAGKKGSEYIYCYGTNPGMNSFCAYLPNQEITITLFSNTEIDSRTTGEKFVATLLK